MSAGAKRSRKKKKRKRPIGCFVFIILSAVLIYMVFFGGAKNTLRKLYPVKYSDIVEEYSLEYEIDKYLVYAVIKNESNFNEKAVSKVGAKGLMQVMDETAADCVKKLKLDYKVPDDLFEPRCNIQIGTYYLSHLLEVYEDASLAVMAYNAGSGNVKKWLKNDELSNGKGGLNVIPFGETERYLKNVMFTYDMYRWLYEN